ncbi:flagellar assembly peptidoglycan hydrolase FlgJ [Sphaerotilus microaerophilus]|uniref:Peptidoglycan hydrolase FlgJ n=1 Tax=Sphaerotilus microaerophilus TaxID=2914710 RepID=A0ABM7YQD8_9BURK|nr:flagellar assembly peptidoglycan hydrolase FlgJ [Sphaerotilus sp. FB-5]BDI06770.1 flagellar rod assembly protein/muramidase FlgJ [Sphaerotilus sp. FB-5]
MVASTQQLATGGAGLDALRATARKDPKGAIREVAKQFESLFMQELMKSMRASTMATGMLDNQATEMATGMLDQQYATQLAGIPGGLADAIARQLERQMGVPASGARGGAGGGSGAVTGAARWAPVASAGAAGAYQAVAVGSGAAAPEAAGATGGNAARFVERHRAAAQAVAAQSGIPAEFMLAQSAHETGWGRREIRAADGSNSHNLFGIKAGGNWNGPVVVTTTTEVINGRAQKVQAAFRAYGSYEESFRDYAKLISGSPRYAGVMQRTDDAQAFAAGLQRAGYATDPDYAAKLGRVIQTTRRLVDQADASAASARLGTSGVTA